MRIDQRGQTLISNDAKPPQGLDVLLSRDPMGRAGIAPVARSLAGSVRLQAPGGPPEVLGCQSRSLWWVSRFRGRGVNPGADHQVLRQLLAFMLQPGPSGPRLKNPSLYSSSGSWWVQ